MLSLRNAQRLLLALMIVVGVAMASPAPSHAGPIENAIEAIDREDYQTALKILRPLAEQGLAEAQYHLGIMYQDGEGVLQDNKEAARWFLAAAKQGHAFAQTNIASMYHNGEGVQQDYKEAVRWCRAAAVQGDALAQSNLALSYHTGEGVPQDLVRAHMWANIAAANGGSKETRDHIAEDLTPGQLEQATEMAKRCMASNYKDCGD